MLSLEQIKKNMPEICFELEDCWLSAMIAVVTIWERDYTPVFLNSCFYYNQEIECDQFPNNFEKIIRKNIAIAEVKTREIDALIEIEYEFIEKFLGFKCLGYPMSSIEHQVEFLQNMKQKEGTMVLWVDTYLCKWNPMYGQVHFPHCVTVLDVYEDKCLLFDALNAENPYFECSIDEILLITNFINVFLYQTEFKELKSRSEMASKFIEEFIYGYDGLERTYRAIHDFYKDLEECKDDVLSRFETMDENTIKLIMRVFVNEYQKSNLQNEILFEVDAFPDDMKCFANEVAALWHICANKFAKIYYLPKERRMKKYDELCTNVKQILDKIEQLMVYCQTTKESNIN